MRENDNVWRIVEKEFLPHLAIYGWIMCYSNVVPDKLYFGGGKTSLAHMGLIVPHNPPLARQGETSLSNFP